METIKNSVLIDQLKEEGCTYVKTIVDILKEPILVLDKDLQIMAANEPFYMTFQTKPKDTLSEVLYKLGNGQWNIPVLLKLLRDILPRDSFFKSFEVVHDFPLVGRKTMILNARQVHFRNNVTSKLFPPVILLAIEDVTDMMNVAETLSTHVKKLEKDVYELQNES